MPIADLQQKRTPSTQSDAKDHSLAKSPEPLRQRIWEHVSASPLHSLWDLQGVAPMVVVKRTFKSFNEDNLLSRAAELGYYFLFALFPTLVSASAIFGLVARSASDIYEKLLNYMSLVVPHAALGIVLDTFNQTTAHSSGGKITFGLAAALWSASVGFTAIQDTLNTVYKVKETRAYWKVRGAAMLVTVLLSIILTLILTTLFVSDFGARYLRLLSPGHQSAHPALRCHLLLRPGRQEQALALAHPWRSPRHRRMAPWLHGPAHLPALL
jgi:membrane protein